VLQGNLSSTLTTSTLDNVKIIDAAGAEHIVKLVFKRRPPRTRTGASTSSTARPRSPRQRELRDGKVVAGKDTFSSLADRRPSRDERQVFWADGLVAVVDSPSPRNVCGQLEAAASASCAHL